MNDQNRIAFGLLPDGAQADEITLRHGEMSCRILTYGGALRSLTVPGRNGRAVDVALGFDSLEDYRKQSKYMGALIGRYANRIGHARFTLNGAVYTLAANDGENSLHGGAAGFDKKVWTVERLSDSALTLSLVSPDGEEGYPGTLYVQVTYTLEDGALAIDYRARSDKDTVCNLTNHCYFNLSGHNSGPVCGQHIQLPGSRYVPVRAGAIPLGTLAPVDGTPMDLRVSQPVGARIEDAFEQLALVNGFDHSWSVDGWDGVSLRPAAKAWSPDTGVSMAVETTMPAVQFYSGNDLAGCPAGKGGAAYGSRHAFCLETHFFPDSPNQPAFPSCVLRAGDAFHSRTVYRFGVI